MKIRYIIFVFAVIIAFIGGKKCGDSVSVTTETDTIYSTDTIFSDKYIPKIIKKVRIDTIHTEKHIFSTDTVFIVKDYNTLFTYSDTLFKEKQFRLVLTDEIFHNRIVSRQWYYQNLAPTIINTVTQNKQHLYLGLYMRSDAFYPNYSAYYLNKKKTLYSASYEPIDGVFTIGFGYKIF